MKARENPFRADRIGAFRFEPQDTSWSALMERLERLNHHAAIVGPKGTGKTTLLEDLQARLRERGFNIRTLRLDRENRRIRPEVLRRLCSGLHARDLILFDGAEQLAWPLWCLFRWRTRAAGGLIITVHAPGRLPTLLHCRTSAALLARIAARMLEIPPDQVRARAERLHQKHEGNIRESLLEWYDLHASEST